MVSAINATQAKVTFKGALPKDVDFTNFDLDGGLTVSNVEISADRKTATITASSEFTRDQKYTVSVFGILDADGKEFAETKGSFTWSVAEGVKVSLETSTLTEGQKTGLTVKDEASKDVKNAKVTVTSFNENIVKVTKGGSNSSPADVELTAQDVPGTADVEVKTTLPDGTILTNTFKVTVKESVTTISNAGYTLTSDITTDAELYANTAAFLSFAPAVTSLVEGSGAVQLIAFGKTNDNVDQAHIDFKDAEKVTSSNPQVATAVISGTEIDVTPLKAGTTTVTVTMKDGSRKTFPVTVTAKPVMKDISVDATSVKLSDENRKGSTAQEGVDAQTITVTALDQFKKSVKNNAEGATPKVTVSSSTDGLQIKKGIGQAVIANNTDIFAAGDKTASFAIIATKDTPVKGAKVTVSYFADKNDAKPAVVKTITVDVNDVKNDAKTANIDIIAPSEIDANAENTSATTDVSSIDFTAKAVYALDKDGNRVEKIGTSGISAAFGPASVADKYVTVATSELKFDTQAEAITYLRAASTVDVDVTADGVTKRLPIAYKNTAVVPNKATVATSPVVVKLPNGTTALTFEELIFGAIDTDQLILDNVNASAKATKTGDYTIGVLKTAKNGGYLYNKPLVSITGTDGKAFATGVNVYGTDVLGSGTAVTTGNTWFNAVLKGLTQSATAEFDVDSFEVDFAVANVNDSTTLSAPGTLAGTITPGTGKTTTFTLVINGVYVKDSVTVEGAADLDNANAAQKAKHNLLASPVQLNVSVTEEK